MKQVALFILANFIVILAFPQSAKKIQRSWVKKEMENLSDRALEPDTMYTRYVFGKSTLHMSLNPAWDDYKVTWSMNGNDIRLGFDTYKIEELTDTSLTISLEGFRRFKFLSEDYLTSQDKNLVPLGDFNGKPLYKANNYITPRYEKGRLEEVLQKKTNGYNIIKATHFLITFIVNEKGGIENIQIVKGISEGFDNGVIKQLKSTAKDWKPAYFKGQPIQTQMLYQIRYLDSFSPGGSGQLN